MSNYLIKNVSKDSTTRSIRRDALGTVRTTFRLPALRLLPGKSITVPQFVFDQYQDVLRRESQRGAIEVWEVTSKGVPSKKVLTGAEPTTKVAEATKVTEVPPTTPAVTPVPVVTKQEEPTPEPIPEPTPETTPETSAEEVTEIPEEDQVATDEPDTEDLATMTRKELEALLTSKGISFKKSDSKGDLLEKLGA